jgi:hypothetical protein
LKTYSQSKSHTFLNGCQGILLDLFSAEIAGISAEDAAMLGQGRSKTNIWREHQLSRKEQLFNALAELNKGVFVNIFPSQLGDRTASPFGRDHRADDR